MIIWIVQFYLCLIGFQFENITDNRVDYLIIRISYSSDEPTILLLDLNEDIGRISPTIKFKTILRISSISLPIFLSVYNGQSSTLTLLELISLIHSKPLILKFNCNKEIVHYLSKVFKPHQECTIISYYEILNILSMSAVLFLVLIILYNLFHIIF
jgi:hypothetical protein